MLPYMPHLTLMVRAAADQSTDETVTRVVCACGFSCATSPNVSWAGIPSWNSINARDLVPVGQPARSPL